MARVLRRSATALPNGVARLLNRAPELGERFRCRRAAGVADRLLERLRAFGDAPGADGARGALQGVRRVGAARSADAPGADGARGALQGVRRVGAARSAAGLGKNREEPP